MRRAFLPLRRQAVLLVGGLFFMAAAGCRADRPAAADTSSASSPARVSASWKFDSARSFADLKRQCDFGPRVPGTTGHRQARDWILHELEQTTDKAFSQDFTQRVNGRRLPMSNIIGVINPDATRKVMLCAHWDTRPTADMEIEASRKRQPIPGANDGASGVAVLLELARIFKEKRPDIGVQIVLFDGEDYGPDLDRMFLGARHYATTPALPKPDYAILIDMIGDKDLQISRERNSEAVARDVNDKVWSAARALGIAAFKDEVKHEIMDDHLPLQGAGWKAIDLIDFDYGPWHTLDDTPDKCAPESLKAVGDVLAYVVYAEK